MEHSKLEKLWGGIQPLANLKTLNLDSSCRLKEIPNLSEATNLERLSLRWCVSLVELPSSIRNLHKLENQNMKGCEKLRIIPTNINLASLEKINMDGCSRLRTFPDFSSNISHLDVRNTKIQDVPASVAERWLRLDMFYIGSKSLKRLTHVPKGVRNLYLSNSDIKKIPDCIIGLPGLHNLSIKNCRKLVSLQGLQSSLRYLNADDCVSLKSVCLSFSEPKSADITLEDCKCVKSEKDVIRVYSTFYNPTRKISLFNCLSLDGETRRVIIQQWDYMSVVLPGKEVPPEFTHRAKGNSITIISSGSFSASSRFKACLLLPSEGVSFQSSIFCRVTSKGVLINEFSYVYNYRIQTEHLLVFSRALFREHRCFEEEGATTRELKFEFIYEKDDSKRFAECGIQILINELKLPPYSLPWFWTGRHPPQLLTEHLFVFTGAMFKERRWVEVDSDIHFEFSCDGEHSKIIECGVQIMAEEGESSSSREWKQQSDGAVSNDENIVKTNKDTCWWSGLKKLVTLKKKKKKKKKYKTG